MPLMLMQQTPPGQALLGQDALQARMDQLQAQRNALTRQLESESIRQDYLHQQLARTTGAAAASIEEQIAAVNASVKQTTDALAQIDAEVNRAVTGSLPPSNNSEVGAVEARLIRFERSVERVGVVGVVGLAAIIVLLLRSFRPRRQRVAEISAGDSMRLDQLQRAVDVIAVEVERISEAQRYMAKGMTGERLPEQFRNKD